MRRISGTGSWPIATIPWLAFAPTKRRRRAPMYRRWQWTHGPGAVALASSLVEGVLARAPGGVDLITRKKNNPALALYRGLGFHPSSFMRSGYDASVYTGLSWHTAKPLSSASGCQLSTSLGALKDVHAEN